MSTGSIRRTPSLSLTGCSPVEPVCVRCPRHLIHFQALCYSPFVIAEAPSAIKFSHCAFLSARVNFLTSLFRSRYLAHKATFSSEVSASSHFLNTLHLDSIARLLSRDTVTHKNSQM